MTRRQTNANWYTAHDLLDEIERTHAEKPWHGSQEGSDPWWMKCESHNVASDFQGNFSWDDSVNALRYGWPEHNEAISEEVEEAVNKMQEKVNAFREKMFFDVHDVSGAEVDIDRYLVNEPECMIEQHINSDVNHGKAIKVLVGIVASWMVPSEAIIKRGSAVIAQVNALISSGMNVELWAGEAVQGRGSGGSSTTFCEMIQLKDYNDVIDPDVLAFMLGHPSMLRRMAFFCNELRPEGERRELGCAEFNRGYGTISHFPPDIAQQFDVVIEKYERGQELEIEKVFDSVIVNENRVSEFE